MPPTTSNFSMVNFDVNFATYFAVVVFMFVTNVMSTSLKLFMKLYKTKYRDQIEKHKKQLKQLKKDDFVMEMMMMERVQLPKRKVITNLQNGSRCNYIVKILG